MAIQKMREACFGGAVVSIRVKLEDFLVGAGKRAKGGAIY